MRFLILSGVATLGGPPLAGSLYDMTKSYTIPFLVVGASLAVSGLMLFPVPQMQRWFGLASGLRPKELFLLIPLFLRKRLRSRRSLGHRFGPGVSSIYLYIYTRNKARVSLTDDQRPLNWLRVLYLYLFLSFFLSFSLPLFFSVFCFWPTSVNLPCAK